MKELNDFLLNLFTGEDEFRPAIFFPNLKDGVVYATDTHVMIAIPEYELSLTYNTNENFPNAKKQFDDFEVANKDSVIARVADIAKELVKARIQVDKASVKCEECDGYGRVAWEYCNRKDKTHYKYEECPECDGEGSIDKTATFARIQLQMIEDEETGNLCGISIGELYFHPFQLYRLFMVALLKGCETIEIFYERGAIGKTVTYFGDIKVLVMRLRH
ncbi:MAG: hypothetical protein LBH80_07020 [Prevotellaceae bacterium]|jgi:Zn finger protein HypA/HybF involved in hydrogenase expression|nr:hypothetical protein [Prevotellaceae bacterium]